MRNAFRDFPGLSRFAREPGIRSLWETGPGVASGSNRFRPRAVRQSSAIRQPSVRNHAGLCRNLVPELHEAREQDHVDADEEYFRSHRLSVDTRNLCRHRRPGADLTVVRGSRRWLFRQARRDCRYGASSDCTLRSCSVIAVAARCRAEVLLAMLLYGFVGLQGRQPTLGEVLGIQHAKTGRALTR